MPGFRRDRLTWVAYALLAWFAYLQAALTYMKNLDSIGQEKIGAVGFCAGGRWGLFFAAEEPRLDAFVPFYPFCNTVYPERDHVSAPLRIHVGDADDWTPAASCITLAQSLKASGQDVAITVYPGALHGFDNPITGFLRMPNVDNGSRCAFRLTSILGPLPLQYEVDECLAKGATLGGNPAALEAARQNVRAELAGLLK